MSSENTFSLNVGVHTCVFFSPRNNNQPCSNEHQGSEIPLFPIKRNYRSLEKKPIPGLEQERYKMGLEHPDTSDCKKALYDRVQSVHECVCVWSVCVCACMCTYVNIKRNQEPTWRGLLLQAKAAAIWVQWRGKLRWTETHLTGLSTWVHDIYVGLHVIKIHK